MLIGELSGSPNHKVVKSISSSGKAMFIDFRYNSYDLNWNWKDEGWVYEAEVVEFVASIKYKNINSDCQNWMESSILMSPNNPNINCSWSITRKFGSYITLDFKFIEVKLIGDYYNINKLNYNSF